MEPDTAYWDPAAWTSGLSHIPDGWVNSILAGLTDDPDYGIPNPCPDLPFGWTWIMNSHGPRAHPILPDDGDFVSVADTDVVYYLYDGNSIIPDSTRVMLDGGVIPSDGAPRDSIHTIIIDPSTGFPDGYVVEVEVVNALDSLFTPLDASSHVAWSYTVDLSAPVIIASDIADGDTLGVDSLDVTIHIADSTSGIDPDSLTVTVNGDPVFTTYSAGAVTFTIDVATDSAVVGIQVCDNIDVGPANWLDAQMTVYISMEGPRAHLLGANSGYICSATETIPWSLTDPDGIADETIAIVVNGDTMTIADAEVSYDAAAGLLTYTPGTAWTDGFYVSAQLVYAEDIYGFALASPVGGSWEVDLDAPVWNYVVAGTLFVPSTGFYDDSLIHIDWTWDDGTLDSVSLNVNGTVFTADSTGFTVTDSMLSFDSPEAGYVLDSAVTYYFVIDAKTVCAFSDGEWIADTFEVYSTDIDESKLPRNVELFPNRPDPFNATTVLPFAIADYGNVRLEISDILGRRVRVVFDGNLPAGYHEVVWDGRDDNGRNAPSGVYNCRLSVEGKSYSQRITLLR